jgi:8-oxo-dGTP pyrophosphatase MutT (NUDIX family)
MKKRIRVAAIIETPQGVLLVQDAKDKYRDNTLRELGIKAAKAGAEGNYSYFRRVEYAMEIVRDGRYSLPGGKIEPEDYKNAGAEDILGLDRPLATDHEIAQYINVVKETVCREVDEELGLGIDSDTIQPILEIQGRERDHIICIASAEGILKINQEEISGIGLLDDPSAIPLNDTFFQAHVVKLFSRYIRTPIRDAYAPYYISRIEVAEDIVEEWYMDMLRGYHCRSSKVRRRLSKPTPPAYSTNFKILDADGKRVDQLIRLGTVTDTKKARVAPAKVRKPSKSTRPEAPAVSKNNEDIEKTLLLDHRFSPYHKDTDAGLAEMTAETTEEDIPSLAISVAAMISASMKQKSSPPPAPRYAHPVSVDQSGLIKKSGSPLDSINSQEVHQTETEEPQTSADSATDHADPEEK